MWTPVDLRGNRFRGRSHRAGEALGGAAEPLCDRVLAGVEAVRSAPTTSPSPC